MTLRHRIAEWLIRLARNHADQIPPEHRGKLAATVLGLSPRANGADDERPAAPDWERQRTRIWGLMQFANAARSALNSTDTGVSCHSLAHEYAQLHQKLVETLSLLNKAEDYDGLDIPHGVDLDDVQDAVHQQYATEVDADLVRRKEPCDQELPGWTISYNYLSGEVDAVCDEPDGNGSAPGELHGFAPTPTAAVDLVAGWHSVAPPVQLTDPPPDNPRLHEPDEDELALPLRSDPATLVDQGGSCCTELLDGCARTQQQLHRVDDVHGWLQDRADVLNRTMRCLPLGSLHLYPDPSHGHDLGFLRVGPQWVRPEQILATYSTVWGDFGGHREVSLTNIAAGLAHAGDLAAFVRKLVGGDPIHLLHVSAWAGPVYELGDNGGHRIHAARLLGLPWLAAHVTHKQIATEWPLGFLLQQDHDLGDHAYRYHRLALIRGLSERGIIDADVIQGDPDDLCNPLLTRVRCRRLSAPWLLRDAKRATRANAAYEHCYPGSLEQLGIPVSVGTQPDAWTDWLTKA